MTPAFRHPKRNLQDARLGAVSVFCGASEGHTPAYVTAAKALGAHLAQQGVTVVYGGAAQGLMGHLATAALQQGGQVIGVMPTHLSSLERVHPDLTELRVVESMHARKSEMARLSDASIVLPGGIGTLDEFFDLWTWSYLGLYDKPIGICNVQDYYTPLLAFLDAQVASGFLTQQHRKTLCVDADPEGLVTQLADLAAASAARQTAAPALAACP